MRMPPDDFSRWGPSGAEGRDYRRKIVGARRLADIIADLRNRPGTSPTIVQCHGCFDIVHPGHIRYLQFARTQGDVLIVSITGDASIDKEPLRPQIPQELRAENLAALELVDWVVIDPHPTAESILAQIRPDAYVKGREYATSDDPRFLRERAVVESYGGRVIFSSGEVVFSSTRLLGAMSASDELTDRRLDCVCERHEINRPAFHRFLANLRDMKIVVVGDAVVDRYVFCDARSVSSEAPMMSLKTLAERDDPGGAALLAMQLAELGVETTLLTALGAGDESRRLIERLESTGVEIRPIAGRSDVPLRTRYVVDERKLFKVERADVPVLDTATERRAAESAADAANGADALILFDAGTSLLGHGLLSRLHDRLPGSAVPLIGGCGEAPANLLSIRSASLLVCSERKLRLAANDFDTGLSALAYRAMNRNGANRMIVTLGKRGLVTFQRPSNDPHAPGWRGRLLSEHLPSQTDGVSDHFGCGESLLTFAACVTAARGNLMQAAYLGSAASAVQAQLSGASVVTGEALCRHLGARRELLPGRARGRVA